MISTEDYTRIIASFQTTAPVDVMGLAKAFGLSVFSDDLGPGVSGMIVHRPDWNSPSGYSIVVNRKDSPTRQRFTTAHEIGHFVLHREQIKDGITENAMYRAEGLTSRQETEANQMAADILMPWNLIRQATLSGQHSVESLAKLFDVSVVAMSIRLGMPT